MNRKALLIACPPVDTEPTEYLDELREFKGFLCSTLGGGWQPNEVRILELTEPAGIRSAVRSAADVDFALMLVKAPGEEMRIKRPWTEVRVNLADGTMDEQEFNPGCPRLMQLFDCVPGARRGTRATVAKKGTVAAARAVYEGAIWQAEGGVVKLFAGGPEGAMSLSGALLQASQDWMQSGPGVLGLGDAVGQVRAAKVDGLPLPSIVYRGGRRLNDFPICVMV